MTDLLHYFTGQQDAMTDLLRTLVSYETFTASKADVDKLGAFMEQQFTELGASSVTRIPQDAVGDFLLAKWNEDAPGQPIMFLIHIDTVWPIGTLAERPTRIEDGVLYGPGAIDMKGGITIVLSALRGLRELGAFPNRPIWVLMTSDEEVGSIHSEPIIKDLARQAGLVLVMEPATPEEAVKTSRKGVATFTIEVEGRPSHAGNAPEKGINAVVELAHQTIKLNGMNDLRHGTSVSVTMVSGGTATNVIPAHASAKVDVRTLTVMAYEDITDNITHLEPVVPGAKITVTPGHTRGPMERNAQMMADFEQLRAIGARIGLPPVTEASSGGGSDGNFTAMMGVSTLDGLGPQGDGLHALHEHVVLASLPRRSALMAAVLRDWVFDEHAPR